MVNALKVVENPFLLNSQEHQGALRVRDHSESDMWVVGEHVDGYFQGNASD